MEAKVAAARKSGAYVTFLAGDGDYWKGVVGLAKGLRRVGSAYPLVVAVLPDVPDAHRAALLDQGCVVREIQPVLPPDYGSLTQFARAYYVVNYSKLRIWEFVEYERMVYLDADIQVYGNIDHLFSLDTGRFYAVKDCFCEKTWAHTPQHKIGYCQQRPDKVAWPEEELGPPPPHYFNAGMFVHEPSLATAKDLLDKLAVTPPTPFAEQDFLNVFFRDKYEPISSAYNLVLPMLWRHSENVELTEVKVVHYCASVIMKRVSSRVSMASEAEIDLDLSRLRIDKPRSTLERKRSSSFDELSWSELIHHPNDGFDSSPAFPAGFISPFSAESDIGCEPHSLVNEAWEALRNSVVFFRGQPVGTIAAVVHASEEVLNYDQVFVRDFVPSALAFLMNNEPEIVKNFLLKTLRLQSSEKIVDQFKLGAGAMPASFKVDRSPNRNTETLVADFGESAIGRVAPVDSEFWWIILLRAYTKYTGDVSLSESPECQKCMRLILNLCLSEGFDTFPTLLCTDGCSMIDRRMGIYGYPVEIQALFYMALRSALEMLKPDGEGKDFIEKIGQRLHALTFHMRNYFWLDFQQLNDIYRYKTEEYSHTAVNKFNVIPDSIPDWVFDFMPSRGGYFVGNVGPAMMDFRWFALGNCIAIISSLATPEQSEAIMDLIEERWDELVGEVPLKIVYPAIEKHEWRIITGCDPKNTRWSYHNGGSWPVLLWVLTAACIKTGRPQIAKRAIELSEARLLKDGWPEYYDGKLGKFIGKQARKFQTWSVAGYLVARMMLEDPSMLAMISMEDHRPVKPAMRRPASWNS